MRALMPRVLLATAVLTAMSGLSGSAVPPASLAHEAYIWQRVWTPQVRNAIASTPKIVSGWRVLIAQTDARGRTHVFNSDGNWRRGRPAVAVIRIDGQLTAPAATERAIQEIAETVKQIRATLP